MKLKIRKKIAEQISGREFWAIVSNTKFYGWPKCFYHDRDEARAYIGYLRRKCGNHYRLARVRIVEVKRGRK